MMLLSKLIVDKFNKRIGVWLFDTEVQNLYWLSWWYGIEVDRKVYFSKVRINENKLYNIKVWSIKYSDKDEIERKERRRIKWVISEDKKGNR